MNTLKFVLTSSFLFFVIIRAGAQPKTFSQKDQIDITGTYQIEVIGRQKPLIPEKLYEIVDKNRDDKEVKYVVLGTYVRIRILPRSVVTKKNFKRVEEFVSVKSFDK